MNFSLQVTTVDSAGWLTRNAAAVQALAAVVAAGVTIALAVITYKYVRLTRDLARTAAAQLQYQRDADAARLLDLGTYIKLAGMIIASYPTERDAVDRKMRESLSWDGLNLDRFQQLATLLGATPGNYAATAVGAFVYLRDRAAEVKSADSRSGYNWNQFPWNEYLEKRSLALTRLEELRSELSKGLTAVSRST